MAESKAGRERLAALSDGVIAVIITIMVLELRTPRDASWRSLLALWPTFLSYVLSFFFVAVVWTNHHHLLLRVQRAELSVMWANFCFLFFVSLIPFFTAYMAESRMTSFVTAVYSSLFLLVTLAFMLLQRVILKQLPKNDNLATMERGANKRNWVALVLYGLAIPAAYLHPAISLALIMGIAFLYFVPQATGWVG